MQHELFEDVQWLHGMLEFSSIGLWTVEVDVKTGKRTMHASQSMLKLVGLEEHPDPEEFFDYFWGNVDLTYKEYVINAVGQMIGSNEQKEVQFVWRHPKLGETIVRCAGKAQQTVDNVVCVRGYYQNITETEILKLAQGMSAEELRIASRIGNLELQAKRLNEQSQAWKIMLRKFLQNTNSFEVYYYPKEKVLIIPDEIAKRFGWKNEYVNMPHSFSEELIDPEFRRAFNALFISIAHGADNASGDAAFLDKKMWVHNTLSVIEHDEDGKASLVVGIMEDITEKKNQQLENVQLQTIYKYTVNNDYECIVIIDLERRHYTIRRSTNWKTTNFFDHDTIPTDENVLNQVMDDDDVKRFAIDSIAKKLLEEEEDEFIDWYMAKNGEHKEIHCCWLEQGKKLILTVRNVEKRWRQEQESTKKIREALKEAEAANHAKSDFLSRVSHDIRTPLNAVVGMTAIAMKYSNDSKKVESCLNSIIDSSNYLTLLINNVLDMAKIEKGKLVLNEEDFLLDEFVAKTIRIVRPLSNDKRHTLIVNNEGLKNVCVKGDTVRLEQLLLNVISNAIKYTNPGGRIEFGVEELVCDKEGYGCYRFRIKDNGIGMDKDFIPNLFNPFERMDGERVGNVEGTGLGMSIAKSVANMMGGDITVESEVNVGTEFNITIYLKLQEVADKEETFLGEEKGVPSLAGKNILLVEDNFVNREIAIEILAATDANVVVAENGKEAVDKVDAVDENYFSVVFMDVRMPIMNGYDATVAIRNLDREDIKKLPIIAMTADAFAEDVKKAKECGMNDHIAKPIDVDKLYTLIRKWV